MYPLLALLLAVAGILRIVLGLKARAGLPMRGYWGVRTPATYANEETFEAANRAVWWSFVLQGVLFLLASPGVVYVGWSEAGEFPAALLSLVLLSIFTLTIPVQIFLGHRAAVKRQREMTRE